MLKFTGADICVWLFHRDENFSRFLLSARISLGARMAPGRKGKKKPAARPPTSPQAPPAAQAPPPEAVLKGVPIPPPQFGVGPLAEELFQVEGYKHLQTYFPTLTKVFRLAKWNSGEEIWMNGATRIVGIDCSGTAGACVVRLRNSDESAIQTTPAYLKVTHLLDPVQWIRGQYALPKESGLPWFHKAWLRAWQKLQDPGNQAYVEAVAAYALGRIHEEGVSPHFNKFYGAFCARANKYRYNLSEDFQSFRHERWFWKSHERGMFRLKFRNSDGQIESVPDDILRDFIESAESDDELSVGNKSNDTEELPVEEDASMNTGAESLHSADSMSDVSFADDDVETETETDEEAEEEAEEDTEEDGAMYAEMENYPVMLTLLEKNSGTMDELFESPRLVGDGILPGSAAWEIRWTAWLFQVVAALSVAQSILGFTHNDLHTNNIVWTETAEEFFYYKRRDNSVFKVPTFGKLFRIIDFGRAIFKINSQWFISDDFKPGNDADGQYAFPPLSQRPEKEVRPNPSFDLCRLAVSLIDGVFPKVPETKKGGGLLSKEPGLVVEETESALYNMVWSWMIDEEGRNIFINADGSERFPDFDLYKHIAAHVHGAVPSQQFSRPAFDAFQVAAGDVQSGTKVWQLFC